MGTTGSYDPCYWIFALRNPEDLDWAKAQGFGGVGFWGADRDGDSLKYYFSSPTLAAQPWARFEGDRLTPFAARAHALGLKVFVNMEGVNPWHWPPGRTNWSPKILAGVITDLHHCGTDRWFDECFSCYSDFFYALANTAKQIGMEYQEGTDPQSLYSEAQFQTPSNFPGLFEHCHPLGIYHYYLRRDVGFNTATLAQEGTLGYGFAKAWGHPMALVYSIAHDWGISPEHWPGVLRACCLIRALQFRVDDIMVIGVNSERGAQLDVPATKAWVAGYVEKQAQERRPLLNIIAHLSIGTNAHWDDFAVSGDAITSGAFHAGYDVACSTSPLADADAYWVYTRGSDQEGTLDLTPEIARLWDGANPVFLQCGARIPSGESLTESWSRVLAECGVNPEAGFDYGDLPATSAYQGLTFKYTGYRAKGEQGTERRRGTLIPKTAVTGTVHAASAATPLIIGRNRKYLIPATCLSWQASYPIGQLLSGCGAKPTSNVWGIAGEKVTALLAIEDTTLEITLPRLEDGARIHVVEWDEYHHRVHEETVTYRAPFSRALGRYHLLVVDAA